MNKLHMNKGAPMSRVLDLNPDPNESDMLLEVEDLHISFDTPMGPLYAVNGISLKLRRGEMFSILGESGCGKSATAKSIMGILPMPPGRIRRGSIRFAGQELTELSHRERRAMMGVDIAWVPQDPLNGLSWQSVLLCLIVARAFMKFHCTSRWKDDFTSDGGVGGPCRISVECRALRRWRSRHVSVPGAFSTPHRDARDGVWDLSA